MKKVIRCVLIIKKIIITLECFAGTGNWHWNGTQTRTRTTWTKRTGGSKKSPRRTKCSLTVSSAVPSISYQILSSRGRPATGRLSKEDQRTCRRGQCRSVPVNPLISIWKFISLRLELIRVGERCLASVTKLRRVQLPVGDERRVPPACQQRRISHEPYLSSAPQLVRLILGASNAGLFHKQSRGSCEDRQGVIPL